MADIRQTPPIDLLDRPDENPIQPPWQYLAIDDLSVPLELNGFTAILSTSVDPNYQGSAIMVSPATQLTQYGSYDLEVWCRAYGNANLHDSYQMGMMSADGRGYKVHSPNSVGSPDGMFLYRYDSPSTKVEIGANALVTVISAPTLIMMRLTTSAAEIWVDETGTGTVWSLWISTGDVTHREYLYPFLGIRGGAPGWAEVGGGKLRGRTQIFRYLRN